MSDFDHVMEQARRLAETPEGKQLAAQMGQLGGFNIHQVLDAAATGDLHQAKRIISQLMQDPTTRKLLEQLGGIHGK